MTSSSDHQWSELSDSIIQIIETAIHQANDQLRSVSLEIHAHPELGWEEHYAHDALTTFMESKGFEVEQHAYGMETAWRATYEVGQGGRTIGFNSEMDALAGIGHACGHNLIAISGCAAAIGVAAALKNHGVPGKVVLLGTPAEEGGGGKTKLLAEGAYKGMDACLMIHPGTGGNGSGSVTSASIVGFTVTYTGKSAHAGGAPETAINALDAAVAAYVNISVLRQQVPGNCRIHGVIAGSENWSTNVIPGEAKLKYGIRAPTARQVMELVPRVLNCFKAGALSTGCEYDISISHVYLDLQPCTKLEEFYQEHCQSRWGSEGYVVSERSSISASTDFGDVTYHLPGYIPCSSYRTHMAENSLVSPKIVLPMCFSINDRTLLPDSGSYAGVSKGPEAHQAALRAASAIAVVGARVIVDEVFATETREVWKAQTKDIRAEETVRDLNQLLEPFKREEGTR